MQSGEQRTRRTQVERVQPRAEEGEGHQAVADEVPRLAHKVVEGVPSGVVDVAKTVLDDGPQPTACVLR